ncbi:MAG: acyl-CoA dehydrogenase, partial [Clostridia bacterium]|nr:acyl-CoA dehydrogenase [Clostridia bacterium]
AFCSDTAVKVATDAIQIFGGNGYSREYPIEIILRNAKIFQIFEGTNQVQRIVIAGALART